MTANGNSRKPRRSASAASIALRKAATGARQSRPSGARDASAWLPPPKPASAPTSCRLALAPAYGTQRANKTPSIGNTSFDEQTCRHPLCPVAHRLSPYWRRPYGAVQLGLCPPHRRQNVAQDRGHRPRTLDRCGNRGPDRRVDLARPVLGRPSRFRSSPAPAVMPRSPTSLSKRVWPTSATPAPRS